MKGKNKDKTKWEKLEKPSKLESAITLILGLAISVGLWKILPESFTSSEAPGGGLAIFVLIFVFIVGIIASNTLMYFVMKRFHDID